MSGVGEWDDAEPIYDLGDAPEITTEPPPVLTPAVATVEPEHILLARAALDKAQSAAVTAHTRVIAARDAHADAEDAVTVAEAKRDDYTANTKKLEWERVATTASVAKAERARDRAATLIEQREAECAKAEATVDAAAQELEAAIALPIVFVLDDSQPPPLYYGSVDEFVREFVCPTFRRSISETADHRWSARWWESAEAVTRLEAMWRAWEHLRLDPATGISVWLRDHADHHLGVLMSPSGPWRKSDDKAKVHEPLPYEAPPKDLFPDVREN